MSTGVYGLHSHSGLERELKLPKHTVLVDMEYEFLFDNEPKKYLKIGNVTYVKVSTMSFANKNGMFKNLMK